MVEEVWLHIGSAKSGTSSLQKYLHANRDALAEQGLAYLSVGKRRASINELAISYNKQRGDLGEICARLNTQIETRPERVAMLSSEMLFGFGPDLIHALLPSLKGRALKVLVYLRRQDRYIEAVYLQKSKNFRFMGTLDDYIRHFKGSGSDYYSVLRPWMAANVELVPRIMERQRLLGGSVVPDAMAQLGFSSDGIKEDRDTNVSPGLHRVQLLQAAARAQISNPRLLQRRLAADFPQDMGERAPIFTIEQRRAFFGRFAHGNEALRARFFPKQETLFNESDLVGTEDDATGIPPFTPAQMREITRLLETIKKVS